MKLWNKLDNSKTLIGRLLANLYGILLQFDIIQLTMLNEAGDTVSTVWPKIFVLITAWTGVGLAHKVAKLNKTS